MIGTRERPGLEGLSVSKCYIRDLRALSITHVDSETSWRGGQQSLLTLAHGLRARGHRQTIVCPETSALAERARAEEFEVSAKISRSGDVVHAHSGRAHNQALRATLGARVIRVVTRHVAFAPRNPLIHRLKYTRTCNGIIAVSDAVREVLIRAGVPESRIAVIHTGIELPASISRPPHDHPFTVGHVGAFTKEKGQDIAIAAAHLLPKVSFILAGEGPLLDELRHTAPPNVTFPGFVSDLGSFFAQIDLFVMPSRSEAWGLAALEAMAHGVPVIASSIQGLAEIIGPDQIEADPKIKEGRPGWLVPAGDPEALANAIRAAASDRDRLARFGESARERAACFTIEEMTRATEAFYHRLLQPLRK